MRYVRRLSAIGAALGLTVLAAVGAADYPGGTRVLLVPELTATQSHWATRRCPHTGLSAKTDYSAVAFVTNRLAASCQARVRRFGS